jgi:hypothetical protein
MGEQQDELFYADTSTKALKKKTLEDLKALAKPSASRGIDKQDSAVASKIIDADMDTSELAELEDVENQGEELSESLGMSDGAGIKGKEPASARLQNQRTPVATVDGADATATPRAGSPGPRVRMQGGLLLPMNVEIDDDRVMDDAEAVEVDQDDLDHIEVLDDVSAMPDRVSVEEDMPSVEMALSLMTVITVRTEVLCGDNSGRQTGEQERGSNLQAVQQTWSHRCRLFAYCGTSSIDFSMSG